MKFEEKIQENLVNNEELRILTLFGIIKAFTYKCEICGEIVFPKIIATGDGQFETIVESIGIYGGVGDKVIHHKVCPNCVLRL